MSSSYAPNKSHPDYGPMIAELRKVFDKYSVNDTVRFEYITTVYSGKI